MNKRQYKKRNKIIQERIEFFNSHIIMGGRSNGKTHFAKVIHKACMSKSYKYFNQIKKIYNDLYMSVDWSNGKDYSVMNTYKVKNGIVNIFKSEILK